MKKEKEHFCRCGLCDKNFKSGKEWDKHARTKEHKAKVLAFEK